VHHGDLAVLVELVGGRRGAARNGLPVSEVPLMLELLMGQVFVSLVVGSLVLEEALLSFEYLEGLARH